MGHPCPSQYNIKLKPLQLESDSVNSISFHAHHNSCFEHSRMCRTTVTGTGLTNKTHTQKQKQENTVKLFVSVCDIPFK